MSAGASVVKSNTRTSPTPIIVPSKLGNMFTNGRDSEYAPSSAVLVISKQLMSNDAGPRFVNSI